MPKPRIGGAAWIGLACLALPPTASAEPLTVLGVFGAASLPVKAIILGLVLATLAAVVVCGMKLSAGSRLTGGSAYLSGLRLGGPLAGFVGAAYGAFAMALGIANVKVAAPLPILAHGAAEVMLLILLGLVSGSVAVAANWAVEARIDRAVLAG